VDDEVGQWLSYSELAELRGIGRPSAVKLALRSKWRRQKGNDGTTRTYVPGTFLQPARNASREPSHEASQELSRTISVLEVAVDTLREQLAVANRRAEQAEQRVQELEIERLVAAAAARSWLLWWRRR
jgi:hypothetical protein